jgi:hypothetical protein
LLSLCINRFGYEVFQAATAREAVDRAEVVHPDLMSPSGNGRKSLAFRRSLEVKPPCADISDDESHEIRSEVPLGMDHQIPPGGVEWGGGDAGARTGARDL